MLFITKLLNSLSKGHHSPVFSHKQNHSAQMQSKDMAPRFSKKGKVNADEVQLHALIKIVCFGFSSFVCYELSFKLIILFKLVNCPQSRNVELSITVQFCCNVVSSPLQISLRPAQSFMLNKKHVPKLQPQMAMIPGQGSPLGQVTLLRVKQVF